MIVSIFLLRILTFVSQYAKQKYRSSKISDGRSWRDDYHIGTLREHTYFKIINRPKVILQNKDAPKNMYYPFLTAHLTCKNSNT